MDTKGKFKRGDYMLLLLYAYNQADLVGRTRLQKIAFLFEKELLKKYGFDKEFDIDEIMEFEPYHYGPFSRKVFDFIELFQNLGLVEFSKCENPKEDIDIDIFHDDLMQLEDSEWLEDMSDDNFDSVPIYRLTEKGKRYVEDKLWKYLDAEKIQALDTLKKNVVETPLKLLIKYIYNRYPKYASESRIKDEILKETKWQF